MAMDQNFAEMLANYEAEKYGFTLPKFEVMPLPEGILGIYRPSDQLVAISPQANAEVVIHEISHRKFDAEGRRFPDDNAEHVAVWEFVRREMEELGMPLRPKTYRAYLQADGYVDQAAVERNLRLYQDSLGITVEQVEASGNQLYVTYTTPFTTSDIIGNLELPMDGEKPVIPIIWGIIAVASILGIAYTAYNIQQITEQTGAEWIAPAVIISATAFMIYAISKI